MKKHLVSLYYYVTGTYSAEEAVRKALDGAGNVPPDAFTSDGNEEGDGSYEAEYLGEAEGGWRAPQGE